MKTYLKNGLLAVGLSSTLAIGVCIGQAMAFQPHMRAALGYLESARSELAIAAHNKGGHRVEALRLTDAAIAETRAGIDAGE